MVSATLVSALILLALPQEPKIMSRAEWGAKDHLPGAKPHVIDRITIHHTGVLSAPARSLKDKLVGLQTFSQRVDKLASGKEKPAWPDIPYHYYIDFHGSIGEGREWFFAGDTNTEYDPTGHLLIVVEGEFGQEKPTAAQLKSLTDLTTWCAFKWRVPSDKIQTHKDYSQQTECPGTALYAEMPALRAEVSRRLNR